MAVIVGEVVVLSIIRDYLRVVLSRVGDGLHIGQVVRDENHVEVFTEDMIEAVRELRNQARVASARSPCRGCIRGRRSGQSVRRDPASLRGGRWGYPAEQDSPPRPERFALPIVGAAVPDGTLSFSSTI